MFLMFHSVTIYLDYVLVDCPGVMPDDPNGPNPIKLKKPFRLNYECLWYVREHLFGAIEMFMDHIDFVMKPWDIEDPETGKREIYIEDKNILRKMYRLKHHLRESTETG